MTSKAPLLSAQAFKSYLKTLPPLRHPSYYSVSCIQSKHEANRQLQRLMKSEKVFGVDLEWQPNFKKNQPEKKTSLVQICASKTILLIQLSHMKEFPSQLQRFLENKDILKSGVDIASDGLRLFNDFGVSTNGQVDLRDMANTLKSPLLEQTEQRSLGALTGIFLEKYMAKGRVRTSNWARPQLTPNQIKYASLDAYASYQLFLTLKELQDSSIPLPIKHVQ